MLPFPDVIDSTMIASFKACPTKFNLSHIRSLVPRDSVPIHLIAGGAFARGLERTRQRFYGDNIRPSQAIEEGLIALIKEYGEAEPPSPKQANKSLSSVMGAFLFYFDAYPLESDVIRPAMIGGKLGVEFTFAIPMPEVLHPVSNMPIIYAGRCDMVAQFQNSIWIEDDKTTGQMGPSWSKQWDLRSQLIGYTWAAVQSGILPAGAIVRGIALRANSNYEVAQAIEYYPAWLLARWHEQTINCIKRAILQWETGCWEYDLSDSCNAYGGCTFRDICKKQDPEPWIASNFETRKWSPLRIVEED